MPEKPAFLTERDFSDSYWMWQ